MTATVNEQFMAAADECVFIDNQAGGFGGAVMLEPPVDATAAMDTAVDVIGCGFKANTGRGRQLVRWTAGLFPLDLNQSENLKENIL